MAGITGMEEGGWAGKLFSSALFCLWLSLASVMVWFDAGSSQPSMTRRAPSPQDAASAASARVGAPAHRVEVPIVEGAAAGGRGTSMSLSRPTPSDGAEPDAA